MRGYKTLSMKFLKTLATMNKPKPVSAVIRFIVLRLLPRTLRVDGVRIAINQRDHIMSGLLALGFYETFERTLFLRLVKPGMTVLDVGANIGIFTALAASRVGKGGAVFSFEPGPENFALLQETVRLNGFDNVVARQAAVADQPGTLRLYLSELNMVDHRIYDADESRPSVEVETVTVDEALAAQGAKRVDVLKIDIQGAEAKAFAGMSRTLADNPNLRILAEFWPWGLRRCGGDPHALLEKFRALGFRIHVLDARRDRLREITDDAELLASETETDYFNLYLQRGALASELLDLCM